MIPDVTDFKDVVAAWPEPIQLTHQAGDVFLTLYHRKHYIEAKWASHITADDVVTAAKVYLSLMQAKPHAKLLNDKSDATGDWSDANDWLEFEWLPRAIQAGMRCLAHVYSNNMFSRLSARDLQLRLLPSLHMRNFDEREEAVAWLLSPYEAASETTGFIRE